METMTKIVVIEILGSMTVHGYTNLSNLIKKDLKIPSFAKLTSNRLKIVGFDIEPCMDTLINNPSTIEFIQKADKTESIQGLIDVDLDVNT